MTDRLPEELFSSSASCKGSAAPYKVLQTGASAISFSPLCTRCESDCALVPITMIVQHQRQLMRHYGSVKPCAPGCPGSYHYRAVSVPKTTCELVVAATGNLSRGNLAIQSRPARGFCRALALSSNKAGPCNTRSRYEGCILHYPPPAEYMPAVMQWMTLMTSWICVIIAA